MLTDCELEAMQECVASALPDKAVILTATRTNTPSGGWKDDWGSAQESDGIDCLLLRDTKPGEQIEGGKQSSETHWIVRLPHGTVVSPAQRLRVNGVVYQILTVPPPAEWALTVDCTCRVLQ